LVIGIDRLLSTITTQLGTIQFSCGNSLAYLGGQDAMSALTTTVAACGGALSAAAGQGIAASPLAQFIRHWNL